MGSVVQVRIPSLGYNQMAYDGALIHYLATESPKVEYCVKNGSDFPSASWVRRCCRYRRNFQTCSYIDSVIPTFFRKKKMQNFADETQSDHARHTMPALFTATTRAKWMLSHSDIDTTMLNQNRRVDHDAIRI